MSSKHWRRLLSFVTILLLIVYGWVRGQEPEPPLPGELPPPVIVGVPEDLGPHLSVRIDSFRLGENTGEPSSGNPAELRISLLVVRKDGKSTKQIFPGSASPLSVAAGGERDLGDFLLTIPDYQEDEEIRIYILAVDEDEQGGIGGITTDTAMSGALNILEAALERAEMLPKREIASFLTGTGLDVLAGALVDWWEEAEVLGEYVLILYPEENWYLERQLYLPTADGNMEFYVSILDSARPSTTPVATVPATTVTPLTPTLTPGITAILTPTPLPPPPPPPSPPIAKQLLDSAISIRDAERVIGAEIDYAVSGGRGWVDCSNIVSAYETITTAPAYTTSSNEVELNQANNLYKHAIETIRLTNNNLYANCQSTSQFHIPGLTWQTARSGIASVEAELNRAIEILEALVK